MNNKFLDKVCDQIISETRIIDDLLHTPFSLHSPLFFLFSLFPFSYFPFFISHCKEVYSLKNEQEIDYVWEKYKRGLTTLMDKKELSYE